MRIDAESVVNEGRELYRSISTKLNYSNDTVRELGWAGWFSAGNRGPRLIQRKLVGKAPAIIAAGGDLTGTASSLIANVALPATDPSELSFAETSATVVRTQGVGSRQDEETDNVAAPGTDATEQPLADTSSTEVATRDAGLRQGETTGNVAAPGTARSEQPLADTSSTEVAARDAGSRQDEETGNVAAPGTARSEQPLADTSSTETTTQGVESRAEEPAYWLGFNPSIFAPAPGESPYVLETRLQFIDVASFYGSRFFFDRLGFVPDEHLKVLGDAYFDTRLIRRAVLDQTGYRFLDQTVASDREQMRRLLLSGVEAGRALNLAVGVALTTEQQAQLTRDIVWYVAVEYEGRTVLVPRLYLTPETLAEGGRRAAVISAGGDAEIATDTLLLDNAALQARGNLAIEATRRLTSIGGRIVGDHVLIRSDGVVESITETIATGDGTTTFGTIVGRDASIEARRSLGIEAAEFRLQGGRIESGGDLTVRTKRFLVSPVAVEVFERFGGVDSKGEYFDRTFIIPTISVGGGADIRASDAALIQAAAVRVNEALVLRAGEILIAPAEAVRQGFTTFEKSGFRKGENTWEYLTITQVPTIVEAGGNVEMIAGVGDTTIRASVIRSGGSVEIAAEQGAVRFETAYDHVYRRATKTGESAVWQSMSDEGVERQTVVHTEIAAPGGLEVRAADGIVVQYRAGLPLDEAIEGLSDLEGLAWMQALRGRDDVDWQAVDEVHRQWQEEAEGLSGPAAVVIAIAIAVATHGVVGPQTVFFANSTLNAAAIAAVNAGFTSLVTQASISLVNNKGDLGGVFDDLSSSRAARAFATSVLVAGLTAGVTSELGIDLDAMETSVDTTWSEVFLERVRTNLVEAGVATAVDVTVSGAEFEDSLLDNLVFAAVDTLGAEAASAIGDVHMEAAIDGIDPFEYGLHKALHAAVGCVGGVARGGDCASSAIGAAAGEAFAEAIFLLFAADVIDLAGSVHAGDLTAEEARTQLKELESKVVGAAQLAAAIAAIAAGADDASDIHAAADAGATAVENNFIETPWDWFSYTLSVRELGIALDDGDILDIIIATGAVIADGVAIYVPGIAVGAGVILTAKRVGGKLVAKPEYVPDSPYQIRVDPLHPGRPDPQYSIDTTRLRKGMRRPEAEYETTNSFGSSGRRGPITG